MYESLFISIEARSSSFDGDGGGGGEEAFLREEGVSDGTEEFGELEVVSGAVCDERCVVCWGSGEGDGALLFDFGHVDHLSGGGG